MNMLRLILIAGLGVAMSTAASAQAKGVAGQRLPADADNDGKVSQAEYQGSRRDFVLKADKDKDGKVTRAEWNAYATSERNFLEMDGVEGADRLNGAAWFAAIDANGDGSMTIAEIDAMTGPRFARFDADGDGFINRNEARRVYRMAGGS